MAEFPQEVVNRFVQIVEHDISLTCFEQWVYETHQLEELLTTNEYLSLLCLDYRTERSLNTIEHLLYTHVSAARIETTLLQLRLEAVIQRGPRILEALEWLWTRHYLGYEFLDTLRIPTWVDYIDSSSTSYDKLEQLIDELYPDIAHAAKKVQQWLQDKTIVLTGPWNHWGMCQITDLRRRGERTGQAARDGE